MGKLNDFTNKRFGNLIVISRFEHNDQFNKPQWLCKCDCGKETVVSARRLKSGNTKSCGCLRKINHYKKYTNKNMKYYQRWKTMKSRCYNTNSTNYKNWGGRGISVCDEWKNNFKAWYDYVSKLPHFGEKGYSLDRINNDGNYEPGNVRWATHREQYLNSRSALVKEVS